MIDQHFGSAASRSPASEYEITTAAVLAETTSQEDHDDAQRHGHLLVALMDDTPVGFAHVDLIEAGVAHLEELDVHPEHGRRSRGTMLVMAVSAWAASVDSGRSKLTTSEMTGVSTSPTGSRLTK